MTTDRGFRVTFILIVAKLLTLVTTFDVKLIIDLTAIREDVNTIAITFNQFLISLLTRTVAWYLVLFLSCFLTFITEKELPASTRDFMSGCDWKIAAVNSASVNSD